MSNAAVAEETLSTEELDELYTLDASESDPEDDDDDDDEEDDGDDEEDDGDDPGVMPQG